MIEEEPSNEFRDKSFQKYDAVVTNAPLTATTKQLAYLQKYSLWKDGLPIPVSLLLSDLEIQDKDKMIEAIEQEQKQQSEMQQQQFQLQMQNQQVVNNSLEKKAFADQSLGAERLAKIQLDKALNVERIARAQEEKDTGTLAKIKAVKELESMRVDDIVKLLGLLQGIESATTKKQGEENGA